MLIKIFLYTHHPIFLLRALAKYDQNVYASVLSGYKALNVSTNPVAKKSVIPSRSSIVNPAFFIFVFGFLRSKYIKKLIYIIL